MVIGKKGRAPYRRVRRRFRSCRPSRRFPRGPELGTTLSASGRFRNPRRWNRPCARTTSVRWRLRRRNGRKPLRRRIRPAWPALRLRPVGAGVRRPRPKPPFFRPTSPFRPAERILPIPRGKFPDRSGGGGRAPSERRRRKSGRFVPVRKRPREAWRPSSSRFTGGRIRCGGFSWTFLGDYSFMLSTPETISETSFVMAAWRALLYERVRSEAFLAALSFAFFMATMRAACSEALASSRCS